MEWPKVDMRPLLTQEVQRLAFTEGATDEWGRPAATWALAGVEPGLLQPISTDELTDDADVLTAAFKLFVMPDSQFSGRDRAVVDGDTYEVIGPAHVHRTPRGTHHRKLRMRKVS